MASTLLTHRPAPPLSSYVEQFWYLEGWLGPHQRERVLPGGRLQLLIDLTRGTEAVVGARSQYIKIDTAAIHSVIGVYFWPGGTRTLFDVPAGDFYNQIVPLDLVRGWSATQLRDRLREKTSRAEKFRVLESALLERVGQNERIDLHAAVRYELGKFQGRDHLSVPS